MLDKKVIPIYKITQTLLNSFNYFLKSESDTALTDFEKVIKKEYEDNKFTTAGKLWEDEVCYNPKNNLAKEVHDKIKDCYFQVEVSKEIEVGNKNILLFGYADAVGYDKIYDIKTSSSEYEIGKYQDSLQHRIYMYCTGIKQFEYLLTKIKIEEHVKHIEEIGDSISEYEVIPIENYSEYYSWQDSYESDIYQVINNFFDWLDNYPEMDKVFNEKWVVK